MSIIANRMRIGKDLFAIKWIETITKPSQFGLQQCVTKLDECSCSVVPEEGNAIPGAPSH